MLAFDYVRDHWCLELGIALGSLEFAFQNRNFDDTDLGAQVRASERESIKQVDAILAELSVGRLRSDYKDFGELMSDILARLGDEQMWNLTFIGICVARLRLALAMDGERQKALLAAARQSLDGAYSLQARDRDEVFDSLLSATATTATAAARVLEGHATPSSSPLNSISHAPSRDTSSKRPTAFLSYARQDSESARRLAHDLKNAGVDIWIDVEKIRPGEHWQSAVSAAIERSQYFIAILSSRSVTHRGYVQAELREALELLRQVPESETFLIPVRLDDVEIINRDLKKLSWVDLFPNWSDGLRSLIAGLGAGSSEPVSAMIAGVSSSTLTASLFLGWQLARYEIIQGSEIPEAQAVESELRSEIEVLLEGRGDRISLVGVSARQAIRRTLARALGRDLGEHGSILIGIAAFRVQLVGKSSDPANNEELRQLVFSALLDVDPSVVPNKHALFEELLDERPTTVAALTQMLRRRPSHAKRSPDA
ncbi:toll/interleukin-1 receptor domain-containing protein [Amycolatopsis sp. NPDC021455]|uniref:toll/interleukin-1 receptor domain-containing protein n=1 Tax=Amycolatopsis sp. NPDC021455 TaxID=3154901 RepID=UPI0033D0C2FC